MFLVDEKLVDIIYKLNSIGACTSWSCQGGGGHRGYIVFIDSEAANVAFTHFPELERFIIIPKDKKWSGCVIEWKPSKLPYIKELICG